MAESLENLIVRKISRRQMIKTCSSGILGLSILSALPESFIDLLSVHSASENNDGIFFKPIESSSQDELILPDGFRYEIIRKWGDRINDTDFYGYNNDFCCFVPINFHNGAKSSEDGLLFINHEYPHSLFVSGYSYEDMRNNKPKTREQVELEMQSMGVSIFRVKRNGSRWEFTDDKLNRRYDGKSEIKITGPAAGSPEMKYAYTCMGTVQNCSGGVTPWGTVISAEENYQDCLDPKELRWGDVLSDFIEEHYGWMVEFDPFNPSVPPKKRTALGRFRHENVAMTVSEDGRVVCYMGDDKVNEHVYKFITDKSFNKDNPDPDILDEGRLFAADFDKGRWLPLDYESSEILKKHFRSQADVLVNCSEAARIQGATECNRPEDIEINPLDGTVFIAFTNNFKKDDHHGSIVRIIESEGNHTSETFTWEVFVTGGNKSGLSCPDNLYFDSTGNLWVLSDIGSSSLNKGIYREFKNNSLFVIPTRGRYKARAFRFASGPIESEMCGVYLTPDEKTMFLSIQHPGENTVDIKNPTSRWPDGDIPKPAVVAITGF